MGQPYIFHDSRHQTLSSTSYATQTYFQRLGRRTASPHGEQRYATAVRRRRCRCRRHHQRRSAEGGTARCTAWGSHDKRELPQYCTPSVTRTLPHGTKGMPRAGERRTQAGRRREETNAAGTPRQTPSKKGRVNTARCTSSTDGQQHGSEVDEHGSEAPSVLPCRKRVAGGQRTPKTSPLSSTVVPRRAPLRTDVTRGGAKQLSHPRSARLPTGGRCAQAALVSRHKKSAMPLSVSKSYRRFDR